MNLLDVIKWIGKFSYQFYSPIGGGDGPGKGGHGGTTRTEVLGVNGPAGAEGKFGRMFPDLMPLNTTKEKLSELAASMRDIGNTSSADSDIPAGYTYFGQFVDHDITLDTTAISEIQIDPSSLFNFRTPKLELDNVYGSGPEVSNFLYEAGTGPKLLFGETDNGRPLDLPRMSNGIAVIGDKRNDENLAVSQMQFAWLRFHNAVVDKVAAENSALTGGEQFSMARETVVWHYQWIVLNDFIRRFVREEILDDVLQNGRKCYKPEHDAFIPVEFSVAAYRMGHSMVRNIYDWNKNFPAATLKQLFQFSGLSGSIIKQSDIWIADWRHMFDIEAANGFTINRTRKLDPLLAEELHNLPGGGSLPQFNLLRGLSVGLPSGQAVASAMKDKGAIAHDADLLQPEDFTGPDGDVAKANGLDRATPLWYYILKEAQVKEGGRHLGVVGSRIVSEVFVGLLQLDPLSFMVRQPDWTPTLPSEVPGHFTMADMLRFSKNVNPLENG